MSFKKQFLIIFLSIFILLITGLITFYSILQNEKEIASAELKRYESYLLADELRQSSDDLTRMARTYTVTSDPRFREYFNKILDIRDGKSPRPLNYSGIYWDNVTATGTYPSSPSDVKASLDILMKDMNFTRDELSFLKEAKNRSDVLVNLENQAMNAMVGLYADKNGNFVIRKKPNPILAQKIMHGIEYHKVKKEIMKPMQAFFQKVDERTFQAVTFFREKGKRLNLLMLSLMSLTVTLIFISFALVLLQGVRKENYFQLWKQKSNWRRKAFFVYRSWPLLILATVAFAINLSFFWWAKKIIEEQVHSSLKAELQIIIDTTHKNSIQWLRDTEQELESFISFSKIKNNYKNKDSISSQDLHNFFRKDLDKFIKIHGFKNYFLIDEKGKVLSSSKKNLIGLNVQKFIPKKIIFQLKEPKKTDLIFPENLQDKASLFNRNILLASRLESHQNKQGFLIIEVPLVEGFTRIVQRGRFKASGESYVFNKEGYLLSESRFNDQLYKIGLLPEGENSSLAIRVIDPGKNLTLHPEDNIDLSEKNLTQMVLNAFKSARGVNLNPYNDYRGVPVVGSWIWDNEYDIGFTVEIDEAEAFSTLFSFEKQAYSQLIVSLLLLLTLTIVFIWNRALFSEINEKLQRAYKSIKVQTTRMEEELKIGRQIQMSMVPNEFPKHEHFSIYAKLKPVRELGGDFYDFFLLDENKFCFFIGDVSGKGVPSALFMAVTKTLLRSAVFKYKDTNKSLSEVNKNINLNNPHCMFATVFLAILDLTTGECDYTNAGHHSSYIKKENGDLISINQIHGPVTGAIDDVVFTKDQVILEKGDMLVAYTDGITEATDEKYNLYGDERLEVLLRKNAFNSSEVLINTVLKSVAEFSQKSNQSDDITLIATRYLG